MKLFITGASGFLGQYVVAEALRRGHQVDAAIRPASNEARLSWHHHPSVRFMRLDLQQPDCIAEAIADADAVIHLAAAKAGDYQTQYANTVDATENLLRAMTEAKVSRLIAIGTFSVFDYLNSQSGATIAENSPIDQNPAQRDIYAQTKLLQEKRFREFGQQGNQVTILRPGMIYGRDALWNACLGATVKDKLWIRIGSDAEMPLTYVENCAEAIVLAAEKPEAIAQTINLVDDNLPTQSLYAQELANRLASVPLTITIPWAVMAGLANIAWAVNQTLLKGKAKLPGLLIPARLHARFKPLHYSNNRAKQVLRWQPKYSLAEAFNRSCSQADLVSVAPATKPVSSL
jgi:2-alkyl-3-oxoalkanoate reductase